MALPQPDFARLSQSLTDAAAQISLIPNIPHPAPAPTLAQIEQIINDAVGNIPRGPTLADIRADIRAEFRILRDEIELTMDNAMGRLAVQLYNSRLPNEAPLRYPPTVHIVAGMPLTKQELFGLNAADCQTTATALGLPALGPNPLVAQRRAQIQERLGAI